MNHALNFKCSGGSNLLYWGAVKPILDFLELASNNPRTRSIFEDLLPDAKNREAGALTDSIAMYGSQGISMASFWKGMPDCWKSFYNCDAHFSIQAGAKHKDILANFHKFTMNHAGGDPTGYRGILNVGITMNLVKQIKAQANIIIMDGPWAVAALTRR